MADNRLLKFFAGVPEQMAHMSGFVPERDVSQFQDPLSYGHMAARMENGANAAKRDRAIQAGILGSGLGAAGFGLRGMAAEAKDLAIPMGPAMEEGLAHTLGLGGVIPGLYGAFAYGDAADHQRQSDEMRNLLIQRHMRGESHPVSPVNSLLGR